MMVSHNHVIIIHLFTLMILRVWKQNDDSVCVWFSFGGRRIGGKETMKDESERTNVKKSMETEEGKNLIFFNSFHTKNMLC